MRGTFGGRHILLVDDESLFLRSTARALEHEFPGSTVFTAANGELALEVLGREHLDVLITDLHMPVLDGYGLLARLASDGPDVPVIVTTAYSSEGARSLVSDEMALELLDKPIEFDQLAHCIRRVLTALDEAMPVKHVTLPGFLQLLETERQSCELRTVSPKLGVLRICEGVIVSAEVEHKTGLEAALATLEWQRPRFVVGDLPPEPRRTMTLGISELLFEGARRSDERERNKPRNDDFGFAELITELTDSATPSPPKQTHSPTRSKESNIIMSTVQKTIDAVFDIDGTIAVALVDWDSGMCLGTKGGNSEFNIEVAAAGNTEVVRAKQRVMEDLGVHGSIQDILITLDDQFHIITPISGQTIFIYSAVSKARGNLAMARMKIAAAGKKIRL